MKNTDIEKALNDYYTAEAENFALPNDDILKSISEKDVTKALPKRKRGFNYKRVIALAACAVLLLGIFAGIYIDSKNNAVVSVVFIDVNPGVEIKLNKNDVVVEITALNGDGQDIIAGMKLEGADVETTLNALIGSMIKSGYITEFQNSVLISIETDSNKKNDALREKFNEIASTLLKNENSDYAVITQKVEKDDAELQLLAEGLDVSLGKAQFIKKLCDHNSKYTAEDLAELSINELTLLLESLGAEIDGEVSGTASNKAYIGEEAARVAALEYLNLSEETKVKKQKISLDFDDGIMVYEVELVTEQYEYEVEVNALNGRIVCSERDELDFIISVLNVLREDEIRNIIAGYGIPAEKIPMNMELQKHDGYLIYEVEFVYQGIEYEFEILATRGEVITYKTNKPSDNSDDDSSATVITGTEALDIALSHVNLTKDDIEELNIEPEEYDGIFEYEIEFKSGYYFYEIKVDGKNGSVIESEREVHEKYKKLTLVGTTGNVYAIKVKINPGGVGMHLFQEVYEPMNPWLGYVDGSYGDPSFNEWITKYTEEWFENNRLFVGELIADGQIEIEGIYEKFTYNNTYKEESSELLLVFNQLTEEEIVREEDGTFYGYYFLLELPKEDYPEEHFISGFGRGSSYLPEDATKYY